MDEGLRNQRDRFMALAFAVGDLLMEVDENGQVLYATGAARQTLGADVPELVGRSFPDLFSASDRPVANYLVKELDEGSRRGPLQLNLQPGGPRDAVLLHAFRFPGRGKVLSLAVSAAEGSVVRHASEDRDEETQLLSLEAFIEKATAYLRMIGCNRDRLQVTFLALDPEDDAKPQEAAALPAPSRIAAVLRTRAISDLAARLSSDRYVVLHAASSESARIKEEIARSSGGRAALRVTSLAIDPGIRIDEAVRVAVYGVHEFVSAEAGDLDLTAISGTLARRSQEIGDNAQAFRQAIERSELKVVGLPIVSLVDHSIQQIEFMVRQTPGSAPYPHFIFADKVGTAHQLDLVMLEYALGYLAASDDRKNTIIATNMAAETLIRNDAFRNITALLAREGSKPKRLVIELSFRSDILNLDRLANGIAALRKSGVGVALDAFGASPAPLNHLRALDLDYVKMAGQWVRGSAKSRRDAALVDAIAMLGKDLDIGTVALDVDTLALATSLGGRGISHGQGRAFGHPIPIDTAKLAMLKAAG